MDTSSLEDRLKADLHRYLQNGREAMLWKLEGLSEYDRRRPVVNSGTNLLGLLKHLAQVEIGYFGDSFGRPFGGWRPRLSTEEEPDADMWAQPDESTQQLVSFYKEVWEHSDATVRELPLETVGIVPWWPAERRETTLGHLLVRVATETSRHAGHADIVRELIDGTLGYVPSATNIPDMSAAEWSNYREKVEEAARRAGES